MRLLSFGSVLNMSGTTTLRDEIVGSRFIFTVAIVYIAIFMAAALSHQPVACGVYSFD